jgi:hypothetical protein
MFLGNVIRIGITNKIVQLVLLCIWVGLSQNVFAETNDVVSSEFKIKAAYLYNFLKFAEWETKVLPDSTEITRITILGDDPFGGAFDHLEGKTIKGKQLQITRISNIQDLKPCHLLYISNSERDQLKDIFEILEDSNILTVGETEKFAQLGGIIGLFVEEDEVRFAINLKAAEQAGIKFSSQLLQVAKTVRY